MMSDFGRGTVYEPKAQKTLAEVYYFIQSPSPDAVKECQGFLEPILEYESLQDAFNGSSGMVLELENGNRLIIEMTNTKACVNSSLPIFFHGTVRDGSPDCPMELGA